MGASNANDSEKNAFNRLPDQPTIEQAGSFLIKDESGKEIPFKTLYTGQPEGSRQLIVFIRHFFCGSCEEYVRALAQYLPPSTLATHNITLTLIGCGDPICIPDYKKRTGCSFEIYANPNRNIYDKLGMVSNLQHNQKRPEYITKSFFGVVTSSLWNSVRAPGQALKAGPPSQNGGEWLFQNGELKFCHRMETTTGHAEIAELKEVLGIQ